MNQSPVKGKKILQEPLTAKEREFAAENHGLIYSFLNKYRLSIDDWYDVVIFAYLTSVRKWLSQPDLYKWSFSTIAFSMMRAYVGNERKNKSNKFRQLVLMKFFWGQINLQVWKE